jgi:hypothetical protein
VPSNPQENRPDRTSTVIKPDSGESDNLPHVLTLQMALGPKEEAKILLLASARILYTQM